MTITRGRPRDEQIDRLVLDATGGLLDDGGVAAVSFEEVARRTGVGRPTIYRRWPDRSHLVLAVLTDRMARIVAPDTGCTLCDLHEILALTSRVYRSLGTGSVAHLLADSAHAVDVRAGLTRAVLDPVGDVVRATLAAARDRGDLRLDTDLELLVDTLVALVFHRLLLDRPPLNDLQIEAVVIALLGGIATHPEQLLAEYANGPHDGSGV